MTKIRWQDITPEQARGDIGMPGIDLGVRLDITAPLNEAGERCPWPWEPQQLVGAPMGQYHCPYCGAMVMAGLEHIDYAEALRMSEQEGEGEMMKKILTRATLEEILDYARLDPEDVVYNWPSGMYGGYGGHVSFALTADPAELAQFFKALGALLAHSDHEEPPRVFPEGRAALDNYFVPSGTDPLGRDSVTYFRGWELEPEEGA